MINWKKQEKIYIRWIFTSDTQQTLFYNIQENNSQLHNVQKREEQELRVTLENDLKLLQKLQACRWPFDFMYLYLFQHERRCQVIEMNKMEESALEKKVSLRLGLLLQARILYVLHFSFVFYNLYFIQSLYYRL